MATKRPLINTLLTSKPYKPKYDQIKIKNTYNLCFLINLEAYQPQSLEGTPVKIDENKRMD